MELDLSILSDQFIADLIEGASKNAQRGVVFEKGTEKSEEQKEADNKLDLALRKERRERSEREKSSKL